MKNDFRTQIKSAVPMDHGVWWISSLVTAGNSDGAARAALATPLMATCMSRSRPRDLEEALISTGVIPSELWLRGWKVKISFSENRTYICQERTCLVSLATRVIVQTKMDLVLFWKQNTRRTNRSCLP